VLGRYRDQAGHPREVLAVAGAERSVLVVDRDALALTDRRLVAHLASDEPAKNARFVCDEYLANEHRGGCRAVTAEDLERGLDDGGSGVACTGDPVIRDVRGEYALEAVAGSRLIPELRWVADPGPPTGHTVSLREVVGRLESYEPARQISLAALVRHGGDPTVSVCALRAELTRVDASRIVLNRRLREAVLQAMRTEGLTASEIAIRCGRVKHDARGNVTGETSWLARRLGLAPESGQGTPTPWIRSDVLGLIARCGLGISPREVELG
jgi:hypothetical protein